MSDLAESHAGEAGTVVDHPNLAAGERKILSHKIAAQRIEMIASLDRVIESLERLAHQPEFNFANEHIRECQLVIQQLEALDPSMPPSAEEIAALPTRLGKLIEDFGEKSPKWVRLSSGELVASA